MNTTAETIVSDEFDVLRAEVRAVMAAENLSQKSVSDESGIPYGTFTAWMGRTYKGRVADKAADVQRWLETRRENSRVRSTIPDAPPFVGTPTANAIIGICSFAQAAPDFAVIVGGAGIGKTTALEEYKRRSSNVYLATMEPSIAPVNKMLGELADVLGLDERQPARISRTITKQLRGAKALLIVDEAQHLTTQSLDQLRSFQDKAGCGVIVAGNEAVLAKLQGNSKVPDPRFAQLYSRAGMRTILTKPKDEDISCLIRAWGIDTTTKEAALLRTIARKSAALRGMTKALRLASMVASTTGETLSVQHIRAAWSQLSAEEVGAVAA
ncbi:AAA family ATPase [Pararhodobacter sp.]|uniref:AAA family ATPase n=1 Tax=Pararhodobacter sp. TaxID=2127056 RepID=UPI002AFFDE72|nr:AAA family ATPase [Pararhodobacter sp.]